MKDLLNLFGKTTLFTLMAMLLPVASHTGTAPSTEGVGQALAYGEESDDKTLSPYFFVKSEDATLDQLPLKSTSVVANILGPIADVAVTQVYRNEGSKAIEAVYVFPASSRASVYGMKMTIGERISQRRYNRGKKPARPTKRRSRRAKARPFSNRTGPTFFK